MSFSHVRSSHRIILGEVLSRIPAAFRNVQFCLAKETVVTRNVASRRNCLARTTGRLSFYGLKTIKFSCIDFLA